MIISHRAPSFSMITTALFLVVAAWVLPRILAPDTPPGVLIAANVMWWTAVPLYIVGSCIYARGIGYPFWLGLFAVTVVGLLILMLLPDRHPQKEDDYWRDRSY